MKNRSANPVHGPRSVLNGDSTPNENESTARLGRVSCNICQHEIPLSEAIVPEAQDYLVFFCGLDCYERWRVQLAESASIPDQPIR